MRRRGACETSGNDTLAFEVQVPRDDDGASMREFLDRYCDGLRVDTRWLVLFDQRTGAADAVQEATEVVTAGGRTVWVVRA